MEENYYAGIYELSNRLAEYVRESLGGPSEISAMISSIEDTLLLLSKEIVEYVPSERMIAESLRSLVNQLTGLYSLSLAGSPEISVPEETIAPIREMAPFVPEEKREEFQKIVSPDSAGKSKTISAENIRWLIGTIISVISIIIAMNTPVIDEEAKQIMRDGNEIEAKKLEVMESTLAAVNDLLDYFQESGVDSREDFLAIAEKADPLGQELDSAADAPNPGKQENGANDQGNGNETQE